MAIAASTDSAMIAGNRSRDRDFTALTSCLPNVVRFSGGRCACCQRIALAVRWKRLLGARRHSTSHGEDMVTHVVALHNGLGSPEG